MLRHLTTQQLDTPCSVLRFSPSGELLLTCAADSDEVTVWRIGSGAELTRVSLFRAGEPDYRFRDAVWVSESAVALCGLYRSFQLWEGVTSPAPIPAFAGRDFVLGEGAKLFRQLYPLGQSDRLALNCGAGVIILSLPDCRILARDTIGGGTTSISLPEWLVAGTFADQAATTVMFGRLAAPTGQIEDASSVEWLPVEITQPGLLHGVLLDPARGMGVVFDGLQGAGCATFRLSDFTVVARYDFAAAVAAGSVWPEEYEEFLDYDEALLCRPRLHYGNVVYPGLSGTVLLIADVFGTGAAYPIVHHKRAISSIDVSDRLIAFASFDSTISLWDVRSLQVAPCPTTQPAVFEQWTSFLGAMREKHHLQPRQKLIRSLHGTEWRVRNW